MRIGVLDCTLRDGGYLNNWKFGRGAIVNIIERLGLSGVDYIELGFVKMIPIWILIVVILQILGISY
ncbi:hypothetical protein LAE74_06890 [Campylobacter coli]|uniref:hypothetical protein n=1 Tax=Campylobacter coli TaxID=195 RepID=UPI001CBD312E|nr:hypothetical protein [Campylobacter coli]UAM78062.1 hypothetical protein K8351_01340 [Campylobacter coli]UAY57923.1 hypothetical protein LAE74_06890 [Campylobacter coli]UAY60724.1 hypothetical protein LAE76_04065 [Campylobacter coli]UAY62850.1 hypothetical protein LAE73_06130 [Campylobacter coli]